MSKEMEIKQECCNIWNNLKDKTKMIDYLIESKQQITDLEAKLAESEEIINNLEQQCLICNKDKENEQLKHQLAEKDEESKDNLHHAEFWQSSYKRCIDRENQDKISFAVDILEELADCSNYIDSKLDFESGSYVSEKAIRDKIEYLKGKKDE